MFSQSAALVLIALVFTFLAGCQSVPGRIDSEADGNWAEFQFPETKEIGRSSALPSPLAPLPELPLAPIVEAVPDPVSYFEVPVKGKYIALTFDDGPSGRLTPRLLDLLKGHDARATFFVIGRQAAAFPEIIKRIDEEGHEVANHTWDHAALDQLSPAKTRAQLEKTSDIIRVLTKRSSVLMRPPYGRTNGALNRWITDDLGMKVILWSVDSNDWRDRDADLVREQILSSTRPGSIILCHDIHLSTIEAMPEVLSVLKARGYQFVTVSELIEIGKQGL